MNWESLVFEAEDELANMMQWEEYPTENDLARPHESLKKLSNALKDGRVKIVPAITGIIDQTDIDEAWEKCVADEENGHEEWKLFLAKHRLIEKIYGANWNEETGIMKWVDFIVHVVNNDKRIRIFNDPSCEGTCDLGFLVLEE